MIPCTCFYVKEIEIGQMDTYLEEIRQENNKNALFYFRGKTRPTWRHVFHCTLVKCNIRHGFLSKILYGKCWLVLSTCMYFKVFEFLNLIILKKNQRGPFQQLKR